MPEVEAYMGVWGHVPQRCISFLLGIGWPWEGGGGGEVVYSSRTLPVMDVFEVTRDAVALI